MSVTVIFLAVTYGSLALLSLFIGVFSPKGGSGKRPYYKLPGIKTPNALSSRDAWVVAHKKAAPLFFFLAVVLALSGGGIVTLVWLDIANRLQTVMLSTLSFSLFIFIIAMIVGETAAAKFRTTEELPELVVREALEEEPAEQF